jgi:assimilatory nitrate reductase catalytic subunit
MNRLLRDGLEKNGPLTREMLLAPAGFGLGHVPQRLRPDAATTIACGYCSTGCGLTVHLNQGRAINLSPAHDYPVNRGLACPKGWEALSVLNSAERATTPLLRNGSGRFEPVDWTRATAEFCHRFQSIQARHGPESVAFLGSGQLPSEELAFLGALAKFGMGIQHGDGNTRQCMASAVVAYKESFGFDAPPYCYADLEESDTIVLVGSNLCLAHPILWERVMCNRHHPQIIVVDPRLTETAMNATLHVRLFPQSDQVLFYGIARLLIEWQAVDFAFVEEHTSGFHEFAQFVQEFTLDRVSNETRLGAESICRFADLIARGERVSFWWTMGVNQSHQGVRTAQALINLALMTGNIGSPGTGANSITGQCNAMGSRLFSNTTNLLGGHDFADAAQRAKVARILGIDESRIPRHAGCAYPEILEGILQESIRGVWIVGTNPAHSWINQNFLHDVFDRLEFLVVQDIYFTTETAALADLVLPAAAWGEKSGTFINSERRIGVIAPVLNSPDQSLSDFRIFRLIAERWGCGDMFREWTSPAAVFQILKRLTAGQPCDITGIADYQMLNSQGGIQWPCPAVDSFRQSEMSKECSPAIDRRLFEDGRFFTPDGRARFVFEHPRVPRELPTRRYPFLLLTGRGSASQWHTQTRTRNSAVLRKLYPEKPFVELNPADAASLGIQQNTWVRVSSQRGSLRAKAFVTPAIQPGQVFMPMHYESVNQLTHASFDPYSRQPSYKACAVSVTRDGNGD